MDCGNEIHYFSSNGRECSQTEQSHRAGCALCSEVRAGGSHNITHVLCCLSIVLCTRNVLMLWNGTLMQHNTRSNNITHLRQHNTCVMHAGYSIWVPGNITRSLPGTTVLLYRHQSLYKMFQMVCFVFGVVSNDKIIINVD